MHFVEHHHKKCYRRLLFSFPKIPIYFYQNTVIHNSYQDIYHLHRFWEYILSCLMPCLLAEINSHPWLERCIREPVVVIDFRQFGIFHCYRVSYPFALYLCTVGIVKMNFCQINRPSPVYKTVIACFYGIIYRNNNFPPIGVLCYWKNMLRVIEFSIIWRFKPLRIIRCAKQVFTAIFDFCIEIIRNRCCEYMFPCILLHNCNARACFQSEIMIFFISSFIPNSFIFNNF